VVLIDLVVRSPAKMGAHMDYLGTQVFRISTASLWFGLRTFYPNQRETLGFEHCRFVA
jgi:hypothetical protein